MAEKDVATFNLSGNFTIRTSRFVTEVIDGEEVEVMQNGVSLDGGKTWEWETPGIPVHQLRF